MTNNDTLRLALLAAASSLLVACGGGDAAEEEAETPEVAEETAAAETEPAEPDSIPAPEGSLAAGPMIIGAEDAPLTIIEYASVTCPGCRLFHQRVYPTVKEQFIDTGKVRFEYRELPTSPQRLAVAGFIVARCAATEGGPEAYMGVVDALYQRQNDWVRGPNPAQEFNNIAAQVGLSGKAFEDCFKREDIREAIAESVEEAGEDGATGTPSFFIDGRTFSMPSDPEAAAEALQAEVDKRS
ncbi:DsbA family protein [Parvularcula maris]|uniref:DsbA family protein n=1 Tax=Parvularcula maris TaxID=2965077 RepID=A0A9X2L9X5_9PROT|nr:DsbA family protein [Parvularcula maris]MCQ8185619.1 DsbA family protein [Parvularcula maris]